MTADQISYLALLTSVASLVVSFLVLYRDRHVVSVRAVPVEISAGVYSLHVSVSNSGRRPISVTHVLLVPPQQPGFSMNFGPNGTERIDVGERYSTTIDPAGLPTSWSTVGELRRFKVFVQDAVGKKHKAVWEGRG
ncbi:hypothetical protein RY831_29630 [Noviherbaspirillum sp. CPCC 100848]|uniref:DUF4426 domain-containing protein n=1 Tax=Noviherbaspirillum album TaxID=3080276 RepID=A0ABU6JI36_9BURK|nr:hypothetical protein [Noviherbaspirillum sp. CPCC 100848]MEC4723319.1 hypothetical protein [Noviherbaspirillum sp. CPCC 100848]